MILVDYSGIAISAIHQGLAFTKKPLDEGLIRHMILNTLRMYNVKFRNDYGRMILCCDGGSVWRKKIFPEYKASRAKGREESSMDWNEVFRILNLVREEVRENLSFEVIHIQGAEADDVIATLTEMTQEFGKNEPVMIISADHDFIQLQKYSNVKQFSPRTKQLITHEDPIRHLREKILRGDSGDGVPNVLSHNESFVKEGARQTPLRTKQVNEWLERWNELLEYDDDTVLKSNFNRNRELIDLSCIPSEIKNEIQKAHGMHNQNESSKILPYFMQKRCSALTSLISDFMPIAA